MSQTPRRSQTPPTGARAQTPAAGNQRQPPDPVRSRSSGSSRPEVERALALRDVMDHAVKVQREITTPVVLGPSRTRAWVGLAIILPLLALSVYSYVARPEAIWGARPVVDARREDAEVRLALFLLAERVEAWRSETGGLPASLADVGVSPDAADYALLSDSTFQLRANAGNVPVTFRSDQPVEGFLGNSVAVIRERR